MSEVAKSRSVYASGYFIVFIALFAVSFYLREISWGGGIEVYRNIRIVGLVLFFVMGIFLMARYYSSGSAYFVFYGIGFLGATTLGALHLFLISSHPLHFWLSSSQPLYFLFSIPF